MRFLAFSIFALAACGQTSAPAPQAPASPGAPPSAPADAAQGPFTALSNTAISITGDLTYSPSDLSFMNGILLHTTPAAAHAAFDPIDSAGDTYDSAAPGDDDRAVDLRRVTSQELFDPPGDADAPNTGLCDPAPTYVAIVRDAAGANVSIIGFSGDAPPGAQASAANVCATYLFGN